MDQPHTVDDLTRQSDGHLTEAQDRLIERYPDVPADLVRDYAESEQDRLADSPIQAFVPILVERAVRDRLDQDH